MAFDILLMPTISSPATVRVQAEVRRAITAGGGAIDSDGKTARTAEGLRFTIASDDRFAVDQLSPSLCRMIFNAARKTQSVVDRGGTEITPLRVKGVKGATRYVRMRTDPISSPGRLCARLGRELVAWNGFVRDEQAEGVLGPDQEFLEPPADPGTEPRLSSDPSGVGARCLESVKKGLGTLRRTVLSQNAQYGVVWRADLGSIEYPASVSRLVCWKRPHGDTMTLSVRPLEMFDPAQSVGQLPAEPPSAEAAKPSSVAKSN